MGDISNEPSMEDILSSIKRIIAEEGESAAASKVRRAAKPALAADDGDEVLELSEAVPATDEPAQGDASSAETEEAGAEASAINGSLLNGAASANPDMPEPILSPHTAEVSRGALDALSRLLVSNDEVPGENTLEALVREMLRPMLREWLDARLPKIVETMVSREISRITRHH